jgi:hypothetical protein
LDPAGGGLPNGRKKQEDALDTKSSKKRHKKQVVGPFVGRMLAVVNLSRL